MKSTQRAVSASSVHTGTIDTVKTVIAVGADGGCGEEKGHSYSAVGGVCAQDLP